MTKFQICCA